MMPIIRSILDNDRYKFSMCKAVLARYRGVPVEYVFHNRREEGKFTSGFTSAFTRELEAMAELRVTDAEIDYLYVHNPDLRGAFLDYLCGYRYDPRDINYCNVDGNFRLSTKKAPWEKMIFWEVPLMAIISELYFQLIDMDWDFNVERQEQLAAKKCQILAGSVFADFGTRRRRSYDVQDLVVRTMSKTSPFFMGRGFIGTSNVHLAMKYGVRAIGTMAHEWIMGVSAMEGLRRANRDALRIWSDVFEGDLGIALTDTYGTDAFFQDFDGFLARLFDGVRHDSGDPMTFAMKVIQHYERLGIDPTTKTIVFSDGLTAEAAIEIARQLAGKIRTSFGIGTSFTNDFIGSRALNMVIKMCSCNNVPVVKLSDVLSKAIGDKDALRVAMWTFRNQPLDLAV